MTDMLSIVARALEPELWERWDKEVEMYLPDYRQARLDKPWTKITESLDKAKAAIEAMREPTDEMAKAMLLAGITHGEDKTEWRCFEDAWQAGVDAALEGKDD